MSSRLRLGYHTDNHDRGQHDDHHQVHYGTHRACRKGRRRRSAAGNDPPNRSADDGYGRRKPLCGCLRGAHCGALEQSQRLPRAHVGHPLRDDRSEDPQVTQRQLFPGVFGAPSHGREGPRRSHPGSLCARSLHAFRGGARQGHGDERHQ